MKCLNSGMTAFISLKSRDRFFMFEVIRNIVWICFGILNLKLNCRYIKIDMWLRRLTINDRNIIKRKLSKGWLSCFAIGRHLKTIRVLKIRKYSTCNTLLRLFINTGFSRCVRITSIWRTKFAASQRFNVVYKLLFIFMQ